MNCQNCMKYFNCEYALISDLQKIVMANIPDYYRTPFKVVYRGNKTLISCSLRKPDGVE